MERYLRRNRLAEVLDGLGLGLLFCLLATGWFTWLWGLSAPSLLAGAALGTLLWTARSQWRRRTVARREKALRYRIGAELMLEAMLLAEAKEAHQQAAQLLRETEMTVPEIALSKGFESLQTFYRSFKRCYGVTPAAFRSMNSKPGVYAERAMTELYRLE